MIKNLCFKENKNVVGIPSMNSKAIDFGFFKMEKEGILFMNFVDFTNSQSKA